MHFILVGIGFIILGFMDVIPVCKLKSFSATGYTKLNGKPKTKTKWLIEIALSFLIVMFGVYQIINQLVDPRSGSFIINFAELEHPIMSAVGAFVIFFIVSVTFWIMAILKWRDTSFSEKVRHEVSTEELAPEFLFEDDHLEDDQKEIEI